MGRNESAQAVVDTQLKVRGIKRLRVIDASVMPVVVTGNTNAPTVMIAEKGADMILKRWPTPTDPPPQVVVVYQTVPPATTPTTTTEAPEEEEEGAGGEEEEEEEIKLQEDI